MKTINNIVKNLSSEERELHQEIIEECLKREREAIHAGSIIRKNLKRIHTANQKLYEDLDTIKKTTQFLEKEVQKLKNRTENNVLNSIPEEKFFVA